MARRAGGSALMFVSLACLIWSRSIPSSRSPRCDLAHAMRYEIWNQRFIPSTTVVSGPDLVNRAGSRHGPRSPSSAGPGGPSRAKANTWLESARDSAQFHNRTFDFGAPGRNSILPGIILLATQDIVIKANKTRVCAGPCGPNGLTGAIDSKDGRANREQNSRIES